MSFSEQPYLSFINEVIIEGGKILMAHFGTAALYTKIKKDHSQVSNIDFEVESLYLSKISKHFPSHSIHSEESGDSIKNSEFLWTIDPLDGTSNFLMGIPTFGTSICLIYKNKPLVSAAYFPQLKLLYSTASSKGVFCNHNQISYPKSTRPNQTTLYIDSGRGESNRLRMFDLLSQNVANFRSFRIPGSVSSHLIPLYTQELIASCIYNAPIHDIAPYALMYKEYGYNTFNLYLKPWTISDSTLISLPPDQQFETKEQFS